MVPVCWFTDLMSLVMWLMNLFWELLDDLSFPLLSERTSRGRCFSQKTTDQKMTRLQRLLV